MTITNEIAQAYVGSLIAGVRQEANLTRDDMAAKASNGIRASLLQDIERAKNTSDAKMIAGTAIVAVRSLARRGEGRQSVTERFALRCVQIAGVIFDAVPKRRRENQRTPMQANAPQIGSRRTPGVKARSPFPDNRSHMPSSSRTERTPLPFASLIQCRQEVVPMPAVLTTRSVPCLNLLTRVLACAALMSAAHDAVAVADGMRLMNPPGTLIMDGPGTRKIVVEVPQQRGAAGTNAVATLYRYDANAQPASTPLSTYQATATGGQIAFNVVIPGPGLYLLETKLAAAGGVDGDSLKITMAALIPARGAFPDAGVVTHFGQRKGSPSIVMPLIKKAGFTWIRDELYFGEVEKKPGTFLFPPDNGGYGDYVAQAAKFSIKPLIVLDYGNGRAYPGLFKGPRGFPMTQQERDLFTRYAQKVVAFYGKHVKDWEIWNEPSFATVGYDNYVALLKQVYVAIKKESPDANVISCGGGGAGGGPGGDCIAALVKAGALDYQDGFSIHPYMSPNDPDSGYPAKGAPVNPVNIPNVWPHLARMVQATPRAGEGRFKLWITEIGWPSSPLSAGLSEPAQAANIARTYLLSRRYAAVESVFWYDFVDDGVNPNDKEANFGLLRADLTPKPSYVAASVLMRMLDTRKWDHALIDKRDVKVYQYGTRSPVYVGWQVGGNTGATQVQIPPGPYTQRDWQGVTSTVDVPSQGFEWQLGALPKYLIPVGRN
ncbi:hypothetical protein [Caballeronia humi]|uniref:Glycoside hydrolase family 5 domain-containing protein n=1 Tax=Caballeronia humi TaxID=326474 RepID=A0A158H3M6_9BURK|nr:hypothetical protein [Caballeronia humi]SAL38914.1 hypothetical protein AWB65_02896 [Caballeronia humi]